MKKKQEITRRYNLSDAELNQVADSMLLNIDDDIAEFSEWGFTPARRADFVQRISDFVNIAADEQMEGRQMTATEKKKAARMDLELLMRKISLKAKFVFEVNQSKFAEFGEAQFTAQNDNDLIRTARVMQKAASKYLQNLAPAGLVEAEVAELGRLSQAFDTAIDAQILATIARDCVKKERIEAGNRLYELVTKYAAIGKEIFYTKSEAKYNKYRIYGAPKPAAAKSKQTADPSQPTEEAKEQE